MGIGEERNQKVLVSLPDNLSIQVIPEQTLKSQ